MHIVNMDFPINWEFGEKCFPVKLNMGWEGFPENVFSVTDYFLSDSIKRCNTFFCMETNYSVSAWLWIFSTFFRYIFLLWFFFSRNISSRHFFHTFFYLQIFYSTHFSAINFTSSFLHKKDWNLEWISKR